ncbi:MAG: hypothetical protein U9Q07_01080 [Planctomycetota bacterium]|nr:hypothetical protein [Planctomycetota bacterium]
MKKDQHKDWVTQYVEEHKEHLIDLPDTPGHILVILKGHLLVERQINLLLEAKHPNPDTLKLKERGGPGFFRKVCLLEELIPKPGGIPEFWELCKKLNDLRNEFCHELNPNDVKERIDKFTDDVCQIPRQMKEAVSQMDRRDRVQFSIAGIRYHLMCLARESIDSMKAART